MICPHVKHFQDLITAANLVQHVDTPTHEHGHTIDLVPIWEGDNAVSNVHTDLLISDHMAIHLALDMKKPPLPKDTVSFRKFKTIDIEALHADLAAADLHTDSSTHVDTKLAQLNNVLQTLTNQYAPMVDNIVTIRPAMLWISDKICDEKWKRRNLERNGDQLA